MPGDGSSRLSLFLLQVLWWLAVTLPLAAAGVLAALGVRYLSRQARSIETRPVKSGVTGFIALLSDKLAHLGLGRAILAVLVGSAALGGLIGLMLRTPIESLVRRQLTADGPPPAQGPGPGLLYTAILLIGAVTAGLAILLYRRLRMRAGEVAGSLSPGSVRPFLVRWFHDSRAPGLAAVLAGAWVAFGLAIQLAAFGLSQVPGPVSLPGRLGAWAEQAVIAVVVLLGFAALMIPFALLLWMAVRHHRLEQRYYRESPAFRFTANVSTAVFAGGLGALLFVGILERLGFITITGQWFDFTPAIWGVAYLLAYGGIVLGLATYRRINGQPFTYRHIAASLLLAVPGSAVVAGVLSLLLALFLGRLFRAS